MFLGNGAVTRGRQAAEHVAETRQNRFRAQRSGTTSKAGAGGIHGLCRYSFYNGGGRNRRAAHLATAPCERIRGSKRLASAGPLQLPTAGDSSLVHRMRYGVPDGRRRRAEKPRVYASPPGVCRGGFVIEELPRFDRSG